MLMDVKVMDVNVNEHIMNVENINNVPRIFCFFLWKTEWANKSDKVKQLDSKRIERHNFSAK